MGTSHPITDEPQDLADPAAEPGRSVRRVVRRVVIGLLATAWLVAAVAWMLSPRPATWNDLVEAVDNREVSSIEYDEQYTVSPRADGYNNLVDVTWRDGWRTYQTTVVVRSDHKGSVKILPSEHGDDDRATLAWGRPYIQPTARMHDLAAAVDEIAPGITVTRDHSPAGGELYERPVPGWLTSLAALGILAALLHLYFAPPPTFATRWAWLWIIVVQVPFIGVLAYLTMLFLRRPGPQRPAALTGGWAFVFVMLGSALINPLIP